MNFAEIAIIVEIGKYLKWMKNGREFCFPVFTRKFIDARMFTVDKESLVLGIEYIESVISECKNTYFFQFNFLS